MSLNVGSTDRWAGSPLGRNSHESWDVSMDIWYVNQYIYIVISYDMPEFQQIQQSKSTHAMHSEGVPKLTHLKGDAKLARYCKHVETNLEPQHCDCRVFSGSQLFAFKCCRCLSCKGSERRTPAQTFGTAGGKVCLYFFAHQTTSWWSKWLKISVQLRFLRL